MSNPLEIAKQMWHNRVSQNELYQYIKENLTISQYEEFGAYAESVSESVHAKNIESIKEDLAVIKSVFDAIDQNNEYYYFSKHTHEPGYIYFIHNTADGLTKIGFTRRKSINSRLAEIKQALETSGYPTELKVKLSFKTHERLCSRLESKLHEIYADHRKHGEWFSISSLPELSWIEQLERELLKDFKVKPSFSIPPVEFARLKPSQLQPFYEKLHAERLAESFEFSAWVSENRNQLEMYLR